MEPCPVCGAGAPELFYGALPGGCGTWKAEEGKEAVTFRIETFGCQMNAHDSEKLEGILLEAGFVKTDTEEADLVLYNTCTVRENANQRYIGRLGYSEQP